jgi:hypothetical protein
MDSESKKAHKMIAAAAAATGKAVLDIAKTILAAVNAVREAAWAKENLKDDLDRMKDRIELVQSRVRPHGLPSTSQGIKALEQLQQTLTAVSNELDALSGISAASAVSTDEGRGMCTSFWVSFRNDHNTSCGSHAS